MAWVALACAGPVDEAPPPRTLQAVTWPGPIVRAGTRLVANGRGAAGARLLLRAQNKEVALVVDLGPAEQLPDPQPEGLPADTQTAGGAVIAGGAVLAPSEPPAEGLPLHDACLVANGADSVVTHDPCLAIEATWHAELPALTPVMAAGERRFGEFLAVDAGVDLGPGAGLLLPGEGDNWLDVVAIASTAPAPATATVALQPMVAQLDRRHGRVAVEPAWLGPAPGQRQLRVRLRQRAGQVEVGGPWVDLSLHIAPPKLTLPAAADRLLQRGHRVSVVASGVPTSGPGSSGWRVLFSGTWTGTNTAVLWPPDSPRRLPEGLLTSAAWFDGGWPAVEVVGAEPQLLAEVALEIFSPAGSWRSPGVASIWRLRETVQRVDLLSGTAFVAGLQRYGLAARSPAIEARVRALVANSFEGLRVSLLAADATLDAAEEVLRLAILDRDPNGLDLLGADSSSGKDVGNRHLGEQLLGFGAAARVAGEVAYGGVFLHGFARFSPTLYPAGLVADAAFDTIFGPWMPELGGKPAGIHDADEASEIMARLIAASVSHELGHALGLPAVSGYHHPQDNPGWRMDEGRFRPFAERVALPGAQKERWGPVDGVYLDGILGKK